MLSSTPYLMLLTWKTKLVVTNNNLEQKLMALYTKIDTAEFKKELTETWYVDILQYKQTFFDMAKNRGNQFTFQKEPLN